jgi:tetratricopeptide (TPR) repeat protein
MADPNLAHVLPLLDQLGPALERNDRARLNEIVAQLIALRAPMGDQWQQLAYIAIGNGEITLARQSIDLLVDALGGGPAAHYHKASFLALLGAWRDADALLRTLPDNASDLASITYSRGTAALNLGKPDVAREHLERVTHMRPQSGIAWFTLSMTVDFSQEPALADRLVATARAMDRAPLIEQVPFHYAQGKMHADRGEHALAFQAFARGAQLMKGSAPYDHAADRASAAQAVEGYTADRIAAIARQQSEPTGRTIFVTGLPRSGTTLVEQILTGHSAVSDGGEIARLLLLAGETDGASHAALSRYVEARGAAPAAHLWHHWLDELFPTPGRIVDKTVDASRFLGLAASLLPDAPMVWMTRDPLDRAWSCFRTNFAGAAMPWSHDLADIAAHFRLEDELMAQWQRILGDRLLILSYEALVTDPAREIRRLLTHCGLAEEPQVFAPHENHRPVPTASMVQVRRPINRDALGAAEPYRAFMAPFIDAYYATGCLA